MINQLLSYIAPHLCYGCGENGAVLCTHCKYNIISEIPSRCHVCRSPIFGDNTHTNCRIPYQKFWCVSERKGTVEQLINAYKFEYVKSAASTLADLLDTTLPTLPSTTVIVPTPTVSTHIRQRGYDHIDLICKKLARRRGLKVERVIIRQCNTVQRGATRKMRIKQASEAFACKVDLQADIPYLLIDDVITTGSTLKYGALSLLESGAKNVWAATIAHQPID